MPLPAEDLRTNRGTWAVPVELGPAVGNLMHDLLPNEPYDPHFQGQRLATTYLDTPDFALRKARRTRSRYLTLRVRCYRPRLGYDESYALSAKTESEKFRKGISEGAAEAILYGPDPGKVLAQHLPPHLLARLSELAGADAVPVVTVSCLRYAVEDDRDRFTLDCGTETDAGKCLPFGVLEYKSPRAEPPPERLAALGLRPIKLSKFLWATEV
jgi:hypothetical protein